jgi:hypothetical protein
MLTTLLGLTFLSSLLVSAAAVALFWKPLAGVLRSSLSEGAASLWVRGIGLGVLVAGVSVGTRIWDLERYATGGAGVSRDQLVLEVYKSIIATSQACVAALVVVFVGIGVIALMKRREP